MLALVGIVLCVVPLVLRLQVRCNALLKVITKNMPVNDKSHYLKSGFKICRPTYPGEIASLQPHFAAAHRHLSIAQHLSSPAHARRLRARYPRVQL